MPDKVKVDCVTYAIAKVEGPIIIDNRSCKGSVDYNTTQIKILDMLGESQAKVTLAHEIAHAIFYERGLNLKETDEETIVDEIGKALIQIIRDNPIIVEYFKLP